MPCPSYIVIEVVKRKGSTIEEKQKIEELLDIVDSENKVVGTEFKSNIYKRDSIAYKKEFFIRGVNCFLINDAGKFFIPQRSKNKAIYPLGLDFSCSGHISSGESYDQAFKREMAEELNLDIKKLNWKLKKEMNPLSDGTFCFCNVYEIKYNLTPNYNRDDFIKHYWLSPEEIMEKIKQYPRTKSDLPVVIRSVYLK